MVDQPPTARTRRPLHAIPPPLSPRRVVEVDDLRIKLLEGRLALTEIGREACAIVHLTQCNEEYSLEELQSISRLGYGFIYSAYQVCEDEEKSLIEEYGGF